MKKTIAIVGGGAAGIMCALQSKKNHPEYNVIIFEKNDRIGKKILKTGNGRCNISNLDMNSSYYNNKEFIERCLQKFSIEDMIEFFKNIGLLVKDDGSSRLYPYSETATSVLEIFLYELDRLKVDIKCNHQILQVNKKEKFVLTTTQGEYFADVLIMATGSMAQEKTNGYQILEKINHHITPLRPGLVPLKTKESLKSIQGIRIKCEASIFNNKKVLLHKERGEILFKDQGLSGILSLNLSRFYCEGCYVTLNLFPEDNYLTELNNILKHKSVKDTLLGLLPKMLALEIIKRNKNQNIDELLNLLTELRFDISDTYGYDQSQITIGGVDVKEIDDNFQSKYIKDMYIIGELLDIDGSSGGYNLHFAWISGNIVANLIE